MFFFLSPTAEIALPLEDYSFIDHLWRDWSPGYDGAWDAAPCEGVHRRPRSHRGRHRVLPRHVGPLRLQAPELADEQTAALMPTPKPTLYLHGRDDNCMSAPSIGSPLDFMAEGSAVEIIDDTGHFLHVEQPEVVNRRITASWCVAAARVWSGLLPLPQPLAQPEDGILPAGPGGEPLGHHCGRHPLRPRPVLRPAAGAGQVATAHTVLAQGMEQAPPALAVRPGKVLRPRRRAEPPRIGALRIHARRRQAHWRAQRALRAVRACRRAHRRTQIEHRLIELPRLADRHEPIPQCRRLAERKRGACNGARQDAARRRYPLPPRRPRRRRRGPPVPCTSRHRVACGTRRPRAAPRRRGRPPRPPPPDASSAPAGCNPTRTRAAPRLQVRPPRQAAGVGKAVTKPS